MRHTKDVVHLVRPAENYPLHTIVFHYDGSKTLNIALPSKTNLQKVLHFVHSSVSKNFIRKRKSCLTPCNYRLDHHFALLFNCIQF